MVDKTKKRGKYGLVNQNTLMYIGGSKKLKHSYPPMIKYRNRKKINQLPEKIECFIRDVSILLGTAKDEDAKKCYKTLAESVVSLMINDFTFREEMETLFDYYNKLLNRYERKPKKPKKSRNKLTETNYLVDLRQKRKSNSLFDLLKYIKNNPNKSKEEIIEKYIHINIDKLKKPPIKNIKPLINKRTLNKHLNRLFKQKLISEENNQIKITTKGAMIFALNKADRGLVKSYKPTKPVQESPKIVNDNP